MSIRLVVLIVCAAFLAVAFAMRSASPPTAEVEGEQAFLAGPEGKNLEETRGQQKMIWEQPLAGEEPAETPDLDVQVTVDTSTGKNRLRLYVTEAHGYYVETFDLRIWYQETDAAPGPDDSPLVLSHRINNYLRTNETLSDCLEVVPAELRRIHNQIGTDANWAGEVASYGRARTENPATFPQVSAMPRCD
jgi:hypothetical protein